MVEINYNIISLIDFLGLFQGLLFGILLMLGNKKNRPSLFLGLFIITFSVELFNTIIHETHFLKQYPQLFFFPTDFYFLSPVLLFLYAKSLIVDLTRKDYWLLIPGIIEFLIFAVLFCFPVSTKIELHPVWENSIFSLLYILMFTFFALYFIIKIIRLINVHQTRINNYYSSTQNKQLEWVKMAAYYQLFSFGIMVISLIFWFNNDFQVEILLSLLNLIFIYWASLFGFKQSRIEVPVLSDQPIDQSEKTNISLSPTLEKAEEKTPPIDELDQDYQFLLNIMNTEQPFINSELTLTDLATLCRFSTKRLSHLVNQKSGMNFNQFINQYRVEAAKKMLLNPQFNHLNVVGIGYEVGFNSKASFYAVFKKIAETTPAKFKKEQNNASTSAKKV